MFIDKRFFVSMSEELIPVRGFLFLLSLLIFISFSPFASLTANAQTYYISSSLGKDSNLGTSESAPWKSIAKVNSMSFLPGNKILFKRGDKWVEGVGILLTSNGTKDSRIVIGAYGSGNKPVITMERDITSNTWINQGGNVWRTTVSGFDWSLRRMWINNVSEKVTASDYDLYYGTNLATTPNITSAAQVQTLNSNYKFATYYNTSNINLYATANPSTAYSSIKVMYAGDVFLLRNVNYVTIQDLEIKRCQRGIKLEGSQNIIIDNVNISDCYYNAVSATRFNNKKSNFLEIKNCNFTDGVGAPVTPYEYYYDRGNWAIGLGNGVDYAKIHNNTITNWHHSAVYIICNESGVDSSSVNYNEVYDNIISMKDINFGRFSEIHGITNEKAHDNRVYRNKIINQNSLCEFSGYHNYIYYNIWDDTRYRGRYSQGERYILQFLSTVSGANNDNYFFNNTISGSPGALILDFGTRNNVFNNLFVNYQNTNAWYIMAFTVNYPGSAIYKKNIFYTPYFSHNNNEISYNSGSYTIANWNNNDASPNAVDGNIVLDSNPLVNQNSFEVVGSPLKYGIDISGYVPAGFKDRNGNIVNRTTPNAGAVSNSSQVTLNSKILLQGAFTNNSMRTTLNDNALIPLNQPYNTEPWSYSGTESVEAIPSGAVDWILVEFRNDTSSSSTVSKRAAFIKSDGSIVDLDGISQVNMNADSGNYYIVIYHRNHLSVMSSNKAYISESSPLFDFTISSNNFYRGDAADLGNGKYGMLSGDGNANGVINVLDYGIVGNNLFQSGYKPGDNDMNGVVNVLDYGKTNLNLLKFSKVPGSVIF